MAQRKKFLFKVVVVGDGGVGKSTMIQRLITGRYIAQKITIGTDLASYNVELITRYSSFEHLTEWYNIVNDNSSPVFVLIGEKYDLSAIKRTVSQNEAEDFQGEYNIPYFFETSSKSGFNNKSIFQKLTKAILEKRNLI